MALVPAVKPVGWPVVPFALKFLALALLLSTMATHWSVELGDALVPYFRAELVWLDDNYRIDDLYLDHEGADPVIRLRVGQARNIVIRNMVFAPHPLGKANASTLLGNIVLTAVLLLATTFAWPTHEWLAYALRVLCMPLALTFLWAADVPMILWGGIWSLHVDAVAPDLFSPLLIWCQFLQGGGRMAISTMLALLVGLGSNRIAEFLAAMAPKRRRQS